MDDTIGGTASTGRRIGWAVGLALAVAAGLAVAFAVASRLAGAESVPLLGLDWRATTPGGPVAAALVVGLLATVGGGLVARRFAPPDGVTWHWYLAAAVLVIPVGAVLEQVAVLVVAVVDPTAPA